MLVDSDRIIGHGTLDTDGLVMYTVPEQTVTEVREWWFCNTAAAAHTLTIYLVPPGEATGDEHLLIPEFSVEGNKYVTISSRTALEPGWSIVGYSDGGPGTNVVNFHISGVESVR